MLSLLSSLFGSRSRSPANDLQADPDLKTLCRDVAGESVTGRHCVYVLECRDRPYGEASAVAEKWFGQEPWWVEQGALREKRFYVGQSGDVVARIRQHIDGDEQAAWFTTVFPPQRIEAIEVCRDRAAAEDREAATYREYREAYGDQACVYYQ